MTSFAAAVQAWGVDALVRVDKIRRASALEVFMLVVTGSPVDTGRLRGNWQTSINSPKLEATERLDASGNAAIAEAMANLGSLLDIIYFTNSLPYVERIEYEGWSQQAPAGMVRIAAARWQEIVAKKARTYS